MLSWQQSYTLAENPSLPDIEQTLQFALNRVTTVLTDFLFTFYLKEVPSKYFNKYWKLTTEIRKRHMVILIMNKGAQIGISR